MSERSVVAAVQRLPLEDATVGERERAHVVGLAAVEAVHRQELVVEVEERRSSRTRGHAGGEIGATAAVQDEHGLHEAPQVAPITDGLGLGEAIEVNSGVVLYGRKGGGGGEGCGET